MVLQDIYRPLSTQEVYAVGLNGAMVAKDLLEKKRFDKFFNPNFNISPECAIHYGLEK